MANPQLYPLEVNPKTGEPFLRLRNHKNIILTPPRMEDAPVLVSFLNDPRICDCLSGPPYPYTLGKCRAARPPRSESDQLTKSFVEHAEFWLKMIKSFSDGVLRELEEGRDKPEPKTVGDCPVRYIREVQEDGTDIFIGDASFVRSISGELMGTEGPEKIDWENKQKREEENNKLPVGDPNILWSFGGTFSQSREIGINDE